MSSSEADPVLLEVSPRLATAEVVRHVLSTHGIGCWLKAQKPAKRRWFHATLGLHQGPCEIWVARENLASARVALIEAREAGKELAEREQELFGPEEP
jgi:hypothetical protein